MENTHLYIKTVFYVLSNVKIEILSNVKQLFMFEGIFIVYKLYCYKVHFLYWDLKQPVALVTNE